MRRIIDLDHDKAASQEIEAPVRALWGRGANVTPLRRAVDLARTSRVRDRAIAPDRT